MGVYHFMHVAHANASLHRLVLYQLGSKIKQENAKGVGNQQLSRASWALPSS
jgi:hypothetical protein